MTVTRLGIIMFKVPEHLPELGNDPFKGTFERINGTDIKEIPCDRTPSGEPNGWTSIAGRMSFSLDIEMSAEPEQIGTLLNIRAPANAHIVKIGFTDPLVHLPDLRSREEQDADWRRNEDGSMTFVGKHRSDEECFRQPTEEELDKIFTRRTLLITESHREAGKYGFYRRRGGWRVRDALSVVLDHERCTRGDSDWFGGVDLHHTAFSGLMFRKGKLQWGWDS